MSHEPNDAEIAPDTATPETVAPEEAEPDDTSRRGFLRASLVGAGVLGALSAPSLAHVQTSMLKRTFNHYYIAANDKTVHWRSARFPG